MRKALIRVLFLFTLAGSLFVGRVEACSLALHDWRIVVDVKIPVGAPFFPLSELSTVAAEVEGKSVDSVYWISGHSDTSPLSLAFLGLIDNWAAKLPWFAVDKGTSVATMARQALAEQKVPLIIGSDKNQIRIVLFSDHNSELGCYQLVIMQTSRIRAVLPSAEAPWAREVNAQAWVSMVFFQMPVPGRIMSLAMFPVGNLRKALIDDHEYVERLLSNGLLMRRPDIVTDPYQFDFPDLPD